MEFLHTVLKREKLIDCAKLSLKNSDEQVGSLLVKTGG